MQGISVVSLSSVGRACPIRNLAECFGWKINKRSISSVRHERVRLRLFWSDDDFHRGTGSLTVVPAGRLPRPRGFPTRPSGS